MKGILSLLLILSASLSAAQGPRGEDELPATANKRMIEDNLIAGLSSENLGLRVSCARMLGQLYSNRATIPLMAVLRSCEDPEMRIAAAWALCRIGDPVGTYFVKHKIRLNEDDTRVKTTAAWYFNTYVQPGTFSFVEVQLPSFSILY